MRSVHAGRRFPEGERKGGRGACPPAGLPGPAGRACAFWGGNVPCGCGSGSAGEGGGRSCADMRGPCVPSVPSLQPSARAPGRWCRAGLCRLRPSSPSSRTGLRKVAPWPYRTSASGLHSKMLLVYGLKCSQGKSATFSRNLGTCVGSRGPPTEGLPFCARGRAARNRAEDRSRVDSFSLSAKHCTLCSGEGEVGALPFPPTFDFGYGSLWPVWSCCRDGKSNCSIETQRCVFGHFAVLKKVTSAQCSECEGEVVLSSTGKRRE